MLKQEPFPAGASSYGPLDRQIAKADMPITWRHGSMKQYFANVSAGRGTPATSGGDDKQVDGVPKMAPVVAAYASKGLGPTLSAVRKPAAFFCAILHVCQERSLHQDRLGTITQNKRGVFSQAESVIRVTQNTDESVAMGLAFARILYSLVTGAAPTPSAAVAQVRNTSHPPLFRIVSVLYEAR